MEFAPLALLGALVYKFVDFLKFCRVKDWNSAGTQAVAWLAGILAITLFANSDFSAGIDLGGRSLGSLNFVSQVIVGLSATSLFSAFYDFKRAIDGTDSAKTPALITDETAAVVAAEPSVLATPAVAKRVRSRPKVTE
jgi:hypothetical protein